MFVLEKLKVDMSLINCWKALFPLNTDEVICQELLYEVLEKYMSMSLAQVTKTYLEQCHVQKKRSTQNTDWEAKEKDKTENFNMCTITNDKTDFKTASHKRLQSEIINDAPYLEKTFTQNELRQLWKIKSEIGKDLRQVIINTDKIVNASNMFEPVAKEVATEDGTSMPTNTTATRLSQDATEWLVICLNFIIRYEFKKWLKTIKWGHLGCLTGPISW